MTRLRASVVAILLLASAAVAFAFAPWPSSDSDNVAIAGSTTCSPALAHDSGDFNESIVSDGLTRDYILHVPASYTGDEPTPLVLNFHGLGSQASRQATYSQLPAKADEAGFILVTPEGSITEFFPQRHWNFLLGIPGSPDDIAFVDNLLDQLETQLCIDASRVFSTGISNGAMISVRLACDLSDRIAAIAPVSGAYYPPWSPDLAIEPACETRRPVPVIAFHGTADAIVPFEGGPLGIQGLVFDLSNIATEVLPAWAEHDGCSEGPASQQATEHVTHIVYGDCYAGADVELYKIDGGNHVWPGANDLPGADVNDEVSASDLLWDFFQAHPLAYLKGDAGCNGKFDSIDAALMLQLDAGLFDALSCPSEADVNGDGAVDSRDAALVLQYVAGLASNVPS